MTHPRLSVDSMCTYNWSFARDIALWSELGITQAGVLISKIADDPSGKLARLQELGIRPSTLITEGFDLNARDTWDATRTGHQTAIDLMVEFGGQSIYFTAGRTTCISWNEDLKRLADAVGPTVKFASDRGIKAAIEPSLRTSSSFVNTLRDAVAVAEKTGIGLVLDFGNVWMERDFSEVVVQAMPHIALVQICDVVIGGSGRPAPGGRTHLGNGELPIVRMMSDVLEAGYQGAFDLEVVGASITAEVNEDSLRRGIRSASDLLFDLGI